MMAAPEAEIIIDPTLAVMNRLTEVLEHIMHREQRHPPPPAPEERVRLKTPTFDGNEDVELFINQFNDVAQVCRWPPDIQLLQLREALKEGARTCGRGETVDSVFDSLRLRYGLTPREARVKLNTVKKDPKTSLQEHAIQIERLVRAAYGTLPGRDRREMVMDYFCSSLANVGLQRHLLAIELNNLDEAVRAGNEYLQVASLPIPKTGLVRQVTEEDTQINQVENKGVTEKFLKEIIERLERLESTQRSKARVNTNQQRPGSDSNRRYQPDANRVRQCWECGAEDHLRRNCPQLRTNNPTNHRGSQQ